ncbi:MAG TPA: winged helix-turn-helix domain-containing protein [Solirubrobacterales bacterium]|jgi:DNA-binding HxlR family transcriptional regulator|nr:winged helix-turn-helix domain-containing protein [Solirubrobacterales bacterium]
MEGGAAITVDDARAGARVLNLLANPLHGRILRAHKAGPLRATELSEKTEWPAQTTLRAAVSKLRRFGLLERRQLAGMPYGVATELTPVGQEVLFVADMVERWLDKAPQGPIPADSDAAKGAVKALAAGWSSTMVRALALEPASLTELDRRIPEISYPSLERRLSRMRATRQVEPASVDGRGTPFEVTDWLRYSVAPLCAAGRCERRHMREETAPITPVEIEASFLLVLPIAPLPESASGTCILSVRPEAGEHGEENHSAAGVTVEVKDGVLVSCRPELPDEAPVWALGDPMAWLNAVIDGHHEGLRFGDTTPQLTADLVNGLHLALFGH